MPDENLNAPNTDPLAEQKNPDPQAIKRNLEQVKRLAKQASQLELEEDANYMTMDEAVKKYRPFDQSGPQLESEEDAQQRWAEEDARNASNVAAYDEAFGDEPFENEWLKQQRETEEGENEETNESESSDEMEQGEEKQSINQKINKSINQKRQQEADEPENSEAEEQTQEQDSSGPQYGLMATMKRLQNGKACGSPTGCIGTFGRMFLDFVGAFYLYVIGDSTVGKDKTDCCISCGCCCNCLVHVLILFAPVIILIFIGAMAADILGSAFDWVVSLFT